jgi:hypothetical protein
MTMSVEQQRLRELRRLITRGVMLQEFAEEESLTAQAFVAKYRCAAWLENDRQAGVDLKRKLLQDALQI